MQTIIFWSVIAVIAIALGFILYRLIKIWRFRPTKDKALQFARLNEDLKASGFAYNGTENYFYSTKDCWQRSAGYCSLYDRSAPFFNMIMDCEPIEFYYGGKRWLIELWKGQYGITTGAEIGVYNTDRADIKDSRFTGPFYFAAQDSEQLRLSFVLRKNGKILLSRRGLHWWLTAFRLGEFSEKDELTMTAKIGFPNRAMCHAFVDALKIIGYTESEYAVRLRTVQVEFTAPHSPQPATQEGLQEDVVQSTNKSNCALFHAVTQEYIDSADKLEFLKTLAPELYEFLLNSLYAKGFFAVFEWILDLITKPEKPNPEPDPKPEPEPIPECTPSSPADCETIHEEKERLINEGFLAPSEPESDGECPCPDSIES